jgi:TIR domain
MAEVFISYSRKDKEFVRKLGQSFNNAKREAWLDWKDIPLESDHPQTRMKIWRGTGFLACFVPATGRSARSSMAHYSG